MKKQIQDYSGDVAEFYDSCPAYLGRDDVAYYVRRAGSSGGKVLELGCGTGRVTLPIARSGVPVTGIDISESMLGVCRRKLSGEDEDVRSIVELHRLDMRDFSLEDSFSLVIVPFRAFQHLETVSDQLRCLSCINRHISDEGTVILDLFNPSMRHILDESRRSQFGFEEPYAMPDGRMVTRSFMNPAVDLAGQIIDCRIFYDVEDEDGFQARTTQSFRLRYIFRFEAEHLLERAGFRVTDIWGDYHCNPFGTEWPGELVIEASPARGCCIPNAEGE